MVRAMALHAALIMALMLLPGCESARHDIFAPPQKRLVWPPAPFTPRIQWIGEISSDELADFRPGFWHRLNAFIFGRERNSFVRTHGLFMNNKGIMAIADPGAGTVHILDTVEGRYRRLEKCGELALISPIGITADMDGNIYFTDSATGIVCRYDYQKNKATILSPFRLKRPTGIAFNQRNGLLYIADAVAHKIVALDLSGKKRLSIGSAGNKPGLFNFPVALTVNHKGELLIVDALNGRIQIFTPDGQFLHTFGQPGDSSGSFAKPKDIAVDSQDHIYVVDALFDAVQVFDRSGQLLTAFGLSGHGPGEFWLPSGISIDARDFIYVSDTYNQRIQIFKFLKDPEAISLKGTGEVANE